MKGLLIMGLFAFLFGCSPPTDDLGSVVNVAQSAVSSRSGMSKDDIRRAALNIVYPIPSCSESWMGGTVQQCDDASARVVERRKEFGNFDPPWMREAIMHWFDHADYMINRTREDCVTQKSRKNLEAYSERTDRERERAAQILKSIGR